MRNSPKLLLVILLPALAAWACTLEDILSGSSLPDIVVTNGADHNDGTCNSEDCTLREAVIEANENPDANIILLPPFNYQLDIEGINENAAETGDLDILANVTITAADDEFPATIDAQEIDRIFHVISGNVELRFLTLRNGIAEQGGAFYNAGGTVRLEGVHITENTAFQVLGSANGGGVYNTSGDLTIVDSTFTENHALTHGGGVFNLGTLHVEGTTFDSNVASHDGGAIYNASSGASAVITNTTFIGNESLGTVGGAIAAMGELEMTGVTFQNNSALQSGGGVHAAGDVSITDGFFQANMAAEGGGLYGAADLTDVVFSTNMATDGNGGGMYLQNGDAVLTRITFQDNETNFSGLGGGLYSTADLTLVESDFYGNNAAQGGGLYSLSGALDISQTQFENNSAGSDGGGAYIFDATSIEAITVANNEAGNQGGGLYLGGNASLVNCTISGNASALGGGVFAHAGSSVQIDFCTIASNTALNTNSLHSNGNVEIHASILDDDGHPGPNCALINPAGGEGNLDSDGTCGLDGLNNIDPMLDGLASNGGHTQTHALLPGSPAIGNATEPCLPNDQRGIARPQGSGCDIGAFEAEVSASVTQPVTWLAVPEQDVNCRRGPGNVYEVLDVISTGIAVPIEGKDPNGNWLRLLLPNDIHCWVFIDIVTVVGDLNLFPIMPVPPTPTFTPSPSFTPELDEPDEPDEAKPTDTPIPPTDTAIP